MKIYGRDSDKNSYRNNSVMFMGYAMIIVLVVFGGHLLHAISKKKITLFPVALCLFEDFASGVLYCIT